MKTRILFFIVLAISAIGFNSCKEDSVLSQDFDLVLYQDFTVNNVNDTIFTGEKLLDAASQSSDFDKYKEHIEDITLTKITYFLTAFNGPADQELLNGAISIADTNGTNLTGLTSMANVNLAGLLNNETELTLSQAGVTMLTDRVKNSPNAVKVIYSGNVNKKPLDFTIKLRFYIKMKAKIL